VLKNSIGGSQRLNRASTSCQYTRARRNGKLRGAVIQRSDVAYRKLVAGPLLSGGGNRVEKQHRGESEVKSRFHELSIHIVVPTA